MQVRWTRPAAQDLERIARRIRQDNPAVALRIAKILYDRCMGLETFPNRGRIGRIAGPASWFSRPFPISRYIA